MSKTLLLADDSVVIQKLVGLSFANEDVEIFSTDNGDDAVTKARELRPDVVLADVVMPGKSGYEVCEAIKKDPALAHIPVLLLTGTFEAFDEARAQAVGATGHITKPFEAQALVERVKTVIKNAVKPVPAREPATRSNPPADDLFDDADRILPPPAKPSFFGTVESLDVTPSISEEDLNDSLDMDLFGPPGDVGGPTPSVDGGFRGADLGSPVRTEIGSIARPDSRRHADAPIEDATVAMLAEPIEPFIASSDGIDAFGGDDLLEVSPLPPASFDLDSAFDPAPPSATSSFSFDPAPPSAALSATLTFARDDANATTSRSFGRPGSVADLDEMLATPVLTTTPTPATQPRSQVEFRPEAPTILDLGPAEQSGSDLDFGFDVSEQLEVSKVDLLEQSFSSLLDVSESQVLGSSPFASSTAGTDSRPTPSIPMPASDIELGLSDFDDFDVSSSDLATATPAFDAPGRAIPLSTDNPSPSPSQSPTPSLHVDSFFSDVPPPLPASAFVLPGDATSAGSPSAAAVAHMSPILQQQVQETLEKVAWEAFSDLSETIVKQVIERVERIAWEVIPQMAETLVREEIRKMKGEED